ncbi:MAG: glycosyltransferase family 39 protein, partial [Desulfobacterales bacterium]|nr:glycosyltransferase family 39 protein [Desulfobacterales bacterium]
IFSYLKRRLVSLYALLGALLFLSLPVIVKLSITVYVDLGLIFFSTASLIFFLKWIKNDFNLKYLLISAVWCGLSLGTKYTGLVVLFLLTLFTVFIYARASAGAATKPSKAIGLGIAFMLVAIIVFSPWAIRNYIWTNNPIYPLYNSWFDVKKTVPTEFSETNAPGGATAGSNANIKKSSGGWGHFEVRKIVFKEKWWEIVLIPIRIFFQGKDDHPKYFDGRLNPLLFFLPICAFLRIKKDSPKVRTEKKILITFSILLILYAFVQTDMRIRYIGPAIPPLVVLSMFGLNDLINILRNRFSGNARKIGLAGVYLSVSILLCLNALYIFNQFRYVSPLNYISGRVGRDAYIEQYRPDYAAIQFANKEVPDNGIILGVFLGTRSYYSNRPMIFNFKQYLLDTFQQNFSAETVTANLSDAGVTHLIVRYDLFNQWVDNNFDNDQKGKLARLFNQHMNLVFSKGGHGVFQLRAI